jgi:hypothetical protein
VNGGAELVLQDQEPLKHVADVCSCAVDRGHVDRRLDVCVSENGGLVGDTVRL